MEVAVERDAHTPSKHLLLSLLQWVTLPLTSGGEAVTSVEEAVVTSVGGVILKPALVVTSGGVAVTSERLQMPLYAPPAPKQRRPRCVSWGAFTPTTVPRVRTWP